MQIARLIRFAFIGFLFLPTLVFGQPEVPVEKWTGKTILLVGAHPDDDAGRYGTLSLLTENGNDVYVMIMTSGNVGTKDPDMTRTELSQIRRREELAALAEIGIPEDHYICLGYTDGMLEFADKEEVARRMVWWYRKLKPDVLIAPEPGFGSVKWHKSDHRTTAVLATDAVRIAEWHLLFPEQVNHDGLEAHRINETLFYGASSENVNVRVDITSQLEKKVSANMQHVSQFSSAHGDYSAQLSRKEQNELRERMMSRSRGEDGVAVEQFRYYRGGPDGMGSARRR